MLRGENIFPKNMISREPMYIIYMKTDSTVKNREYAFAKTFESVFDEDTFFNSCLQILLPWRSLKVSGNAPAAMQKKSEKKAPHPSFAALFIRARPRELFARSFHISHSLGEWEGEAERRCHSIQRR